MKVIFIKKISPKIKKKKMKNKMKMKQFYNLKTQTAQNSIYPYAMEIKTIEDLRKVVVYDHVSAKFKDDYRKNDNFICSDLICLM